MEHSSEKQEPASLQAVHRPRTGGPPLFHWIVQGFMVALPEIQAAFQLNPVGVGGIRSARELASWPVDMLRRYREQLLAACLAISVSPVYLLLLVNMALGAASATWPVPWSPQPCRCSSADGS